jgi:hypothetical protein
MNTSVKMECKRIKHAEGWYSSSVHRLHHIQLFVGTDTHTVPLTNHSTFLKCFFITLNTITTLKKVVVIKAF